MAEASTSQLLDEEGAISDKFESVLRTVFLRYATPTPNTTASASTSEPAPSSNSSTDKGKQIAARDEEPDFDVYSNERTLSRTDFADFTQETNGQPLTEETWSEICEFMVDDDDDEDEAEDGQEGERKDQPVVSLDDKRLGFKGLMQLYQLQTENDLDETISDLKSWGFDEELNLVTSRKDVPEEGERPALEDLTGFGLGGEKKEEEKKD